MARPNKIGLEYFSLDVKMDDEVELIQAQHGMEGFGILISMYQTIYANEGYYYKWNERNQILFSNKVSADKNLVCSVINDCIKWDIFNNKLYEKYKILTSRRIQKQYIDATYRRSEVEIIKEYLVIKENDRENITYIRVSDSKNPPATNVNDSKSTQSNKDKDKDKDKDKESNKEHSPAKQDNPAEKIPYGEIVDYFNMRTGSQYRSSTKKTQSLIKARWNEGFRLQDFKNVIDKKCVEWIDDKKMEKYLRPLTLFGTKFESYLNQLSVKSGNEDKYQKQHDVMKELYQEFEEDEND